ncbi:MAG: glycosyltransferase, partial [Arthrobacter rhombi]
MKILVYPHDLSIGGSQLNAVEIAAAVQERGHSIAIIGSPGQLETRIAELGIEFIELAAPGRRPSPRTVREV